MFDKMKLRQRILLGYLVPFLLLLGVMTLVYSNLRIATREMHHMDETSAFIPDVLTAGDCLVRIQRAAYAYVLMNGKTDVIEELSASSRQSAEQAANAAAVAEKAGLATEQGDEATRQAVVAMGSLKEKIGAMAEQILHLGEQTGQIGNIATVLKDLAGQINMLALNAAVEAARAGEHGKGFAVVASEIRKLADESKKSAEQTAHIRAEPRYQDLPVILVTSLASDEDKRRGLDVGANAYIPKPSFDQRILLDTLKRLI